MCATYTAMDRVLIPVELQNQDDDVLSSTRQLSQTAFCLRGMTETTDVNDVNPYNLRDFENKLAIPLPRTNCLKNSFSYSGATL